jgi:hypothetical protein
VAAEQALQKSAIDFTFTGKPPFTCEEDRNRIALDGYLLGWKASYQSFGSLAYAGIVAHNGRLFTLILATNV